MTTLPKPILFSTTSLVAYLCWLIFERWKLLEALDLIIIAAIGFCASFVLLLFLVVALRVKLFEHALNTRWRLLLVPLVGGNAWLFFFYSAARIFLEIAVRMRMEDEFNNSLQFIWSKSDFIFWVFFSLAGVALLSRKTERKKTGTEVVNSKTETEIVN